MSRIARENMNTSFFHVIVQGVNKEYIFNNNRYKGKYLQFIKEAKKQYQINIIAYVIMSNHTHLLLHTDYTRVLSEFMNKINEDYGRYYNYMENRVGHVFRDRFLSEPITYEKYLLNCIAYIHNNPVKANIVEKNEEYKFSSYLDYINKTGFVNEDIIELVFGRKKLDIDNYLLIHTKKPYYFAEYDDILQENMNELINEIEEEYGKNIFKIVQNPKYLEKIVLEIKDRIKISNNQLANYLQVDKNKIYRILK